MDSFKESIQLASGVYLQASTEKFRLHHWLPWEGGPGPDQLLVSGDFDVLRQLMAGAFYAGLTQRKKPAPTQTASVSTLLRYIHSLASSYQTTHATPPIMRRVAQRLALSGQSVVAEHCLHVAEEESGHDALALMDLTALGLPAQAFVSRLRPKNALALVDQFSRFADSDQPIAVLGYAYALERMALFNTEASIAAIERHLPANINATRCLRVHSAVGSDSGHVTESLACIASMAPQARATIVGAVYVTAQLQSGVTPDYPGDAAMRALLDEFEWSMAEDLVA